MLTGKSAGQPGTATHLRPSIEADRVSVVYPNGHQALRNVSFTLGSGTVCGLVGINGSGKSTLFKTIMGLIRPTEGSISLCGLAVGAALKRQAVAYVPQSEDVDWNYPVLVEDVVMMGRYGHMGMMRMASRLDRDRTDDALERVGMADLRHRQIGELSGGQRKRVFLARALAQESVIILLDEPFTGVDVKTETAIMELLLALREAGHLMLVSTHNLGSVPEFCDQVLLINRTLLAAGSTQSVFTQDNLERAFGGVLRHYTLAGPRLHDDADPRRVTVLTDDERPVVFYGESRKDAKTGDGEGST
ncbi:ATP-binding cassette domain-containing protein [Aestuariivirga sp.]|uniref:ATP-binding cassette domain-containing protein n=1 Tax=Aestuariivirga sp. TaxID=2650926 RepID=UPI00391BEBE0